MGGRVGVLWGFMGVSGGLRGFVGVYRGFWGFMGFRFLGGFLTGIKRPALNLGGGFDRKSREFDYFLKIGEMGKSKKLERRVVNRHKIMNFR